MVSNCMCYHCIKILPLSHGKKMNNDKTVVLYKQNTLIIKLHQQLFIIFGEFTEQCQTHVIKTNLQSNEQICSIFLPPK